MRPINDVPCARLSRAATKVNQTDGCVEASRDANADEKICWSITIIVVTLSSQCIIFAFPFSPSLKLRVGRKHRVEVSEELPITRVHVILQHQQGYSLPPFRRPGGIQSHEERRVPSPGKITLKVAPGCCRDEPVRLVRSSLWIDHNQPTSQPANPTQPKKKREGTNI